MFRRSVSVLSVMAMVFALVVAPFPVEVDAAACTPTGTAVTTEPELQAEMVLANAAGADYTICVDPGTYLITATLDYTGTDTLTIIGTGPTADLHILDGQDTRQILTTTTGSLTLNTLQFQNGVSTEHGGAVSASDASGTGLNFNVIDLSFVDNDAPEFGGGAFLDSDFASGGVVSVIDSTFTGNTGGNGGGLYVDGGAGQDIVSGNTFTGNAADDTAGPSFGNGGGLHVDRSRALLISDNSFTMNTAVEGGGAFVRRSSEASIADNSFTQNSATGDDGGGGLFVDNTEPATIDSTFTNNTSTVEGGGLSIDRSGDDGAVQILGAFNGNSGSSGGAIFIDRSESTTITASFDGNTATGPLGDTVGGGALHINANADNEFLIDGSTFTGNSSTNSHGGAILVTASSEPVSIVDSTFTSNNAAENGGAIGATTLTATLSVTGSDFDSNGAGQYGGAIDTCCVADLGDVTISDSTFDQNTAGQSGGAVRQCCGEPGTTASLTVSDSTFTNNEAGLTSGGARGGAIYQCCEVGDTTIADSTFIGNKALDASLNDFNAGGAVATSSEAGDVTITGSMFHENEATFDGGAVRICCGESIELTVADSTFTSNESGALGGAISLDSVAAGNGEMSVTNSYFEDNSAEEGGGAIGVSSLPDSVLSLADSTFVGNSSPGFGSAVSINSSAGATVDAVRVVFDGNTATEDDGGALFLRSIGSAVVEYSLFSENTAVGDAGGMKVNDVDDITIRGTTFVGNSAGDAGGAFAQIRSNALIENSTFVGNSAGEDGNLYQANNDAGYDGEVALIHVTAGADQDIFLESSGGGSSTLNVTSSVLAGCSGGTTVSGGHNFDTDGACGLGGPGDIAGADPLLGPLADNEGKTAGAPGMERVIQTMLPGLLSPLVNAGASLPTDQRGVARPYGSAPDIGAVEFVFDPPANYDPFTDDDGSIFENDIEWIAWHGITRGCNPPANTLFCPGNDVSREAFAALMSRALGLTEIDPGIDFTDVADSNIFENDILRLATAGITKGCNPPTNDEFCPKDVLSREALAAFFVRGFGYTDIDAGIDFVDVPNSNIFQADILKLATAKVTRGCNPPTNDLFCPKDDVKRDTFAAFMKRALRPDG